MQAWKLFALNSDPNYEEKKIPSNEIIERKYHVIVENLLYLVRRKFYLSKAATLVASMIMWWKLLSDLKQRATFSECPCLLVSVKNVSSPIKIFPE